MNLEVINPILQGVVSDLMRTYWKWVERDDVAQELYVWACKHPAQIEEKLAEEYGEHWLRRSLRNAGRKYCQEQKADFLGYSTDDLFYWQHADIEEALKSMFDWSKWVEAPRFDDAKVTNTKPPGEGGNWQATLADISLAFTHLTGKEKDILRRLYGHGERQSDVAKDFNVRQGTVSEWKTAAIKKLHESMGGGRPWDCKDDCECGGSNVTGSRKVMSNAEAMARTGAEWSGE